MRILIDMNLSPSWIEYLSEEGFEAKHWSDIGNPAASDTIIFQWAQKNGFIVFTHDLDFGAILAATKAEGPSVIQVRTQDTMPQKLSQKVIKVLNEYQEVLEKGALLTIDEIKARIRVLPID
jgi:predicted nuclease of predicted toxin-antitoxin system